MITKSQLSKSFCFVLIVVLTDLIAGHVIGKLYFTQTAGPNASLSYSIQACKADILILGNSRAQHHYDSRIISDGLKLSSYNAGQDGGHSILLQYALVKLITNRYTPKIILLEFDPKTIICSSEAYDKLTILLPYYSKYKSLHSLIGLRGQYEDLKLISKIYPFNSNIINIIRFNLNTHSARKKDFDGYVPINDKVMNANMVRPEIVSPSVIDTNMVNALKNIIKICKQKEISLYIISSPVFHQANKPAAKPNPSAKVALNIIHQANIAYFDFSNDSVFTDKLEWFADQNHLNEKGATIFSKLVTQIISHHQYSEPLNATK